MDYPWTQSAKIRSSYILRRFFDSLWYRVMLTLLTLLAQLRHAAQPCLTMASAPPMLAASLLLGIQTMASKCAGCKAFLSKVRLCRFFPAAPVTSVKLVLSICQNVRWTRSHKENHKQTTISDIITFIPADSMTAVVESRFWALACNRLHPFSDVLWHLMCALLGEGLRFERSA